MIVMCFKVGPLGLSPKKIGERISKDGKYILVPLPRQEIHRNKRFNTFSPRRGHCQGNRRLERAEDHRPAHSPEQTSYGQIIVRIILGTFS